MRNLFNEIEIALANIREGWTNPAKAFSLASSVIALRAPLSVEVGCYAGKGLAALAMAHRAIGIGKVIGIDPYSPAASSEGQSNPEDKKFWGEQVDHEMIYGYCKDRLKELELEPWYELIRARSDSVTPPKDIYILRIDGNHGPEAVKDAKRYAPNVVKGGLLYLDDKNWHGGFTNQAADWLRNNGWKSMFMCEDSEVFQKL